MRSPRIYIEVKGNKYQLNLKDSCIKSAKLVVDEDDSPFLEIYNANGGFDWLYLDKVED